MRRRLVPTSLLAPALAVVAACVSGEPIPLPGMWTSGADAGVDAGAVDGGADADGGPAVDSSPTQDTGLTADVASEAGPTIDQAGVARDPASSIDAGVVAAAAAANNAFAFDLYAHVRAKQTTPGNLLTSPISASLALTMAYAGAQGQTATEMATALHYGTAASSIFDGQNGLSQALASRAASAFAAAQQQPYVWPSAMPSNFKLQVVNSVWGEQTYPWAQPFLATLAKSYGTGVYLEDFIHQWDPARLAINAWVSQETDNGINDILPPGALDNATRMVLVNAVDLGLPWAQPFSTSNTFPYTFTRTDESTVSASFMSYGGASYVDDGNAQIVALPLVGGQIFVVFALPDDGDLSTYEAGLTAATPNALAPPAPTMGALLTLPKVGFTSPTFSLATSLQAMAMVQAFNSSLANFTGMCAAPDGENLHVSDVLQKATLTMVEQGVTASAATTVVVTAGTLPPNVTYVTLDRPFVVAIVDGPTGAILFLGHIEDPTDPGNP